MYRLENKYNESALFDSVQISLFLEQGGIYDTIPLQCSVLFGKSKIENKGDPDELIEVYFRHCHLRLHKKNMNVLPNPKRYRRTVSQDIFSKKIAKQKDRIDSKEYGGGVAMELLASSLQKIVGGKISAHVGVDRKKEDKEKEDESRNPTFRIVQECAGDRWEIGNFYIGDPETVDGALIGEYLDVPGDFCSNEHETMLCALNPDDKDAECALWLEISVELKGCELTVVDKKTGEKKEFPSDKAYKFWKAIELKNIRDEQVATGLNPKSGEIVVARSVAQFERVRQ